MSEAQVDGSWIAPFIDKATDVGQNHILSCVRLILTTTTYPLNTPPDAVLTDILRRVEAIPRLNTGKRT